MVVIPSPTPLIGCQPFQTEHRHPLGESMQNGVESLVELGVVDSDAETAQPSV